MVIKKQFNELSNQELYEIFKLRTDVFLVEQGIREPEIDDHDQEALHFFIKHDFKIISYARVINYYDSPKIQRVVTNVEYRNQGYSTQIITHIKQLYDSLIVSSQIDKISFYSKLGFMKVGKTYKEAGIVHQKMVYIK